MSPQTSVLTGFAPWKLFSTPVRQSLVGSHTEKQG
jgi:hypothetical protein